MKTQQHKQQQQQQLSATKPKKTCRSLVWSVQKKLLLLFNSKASSAVDIVRLFALLCPVFRCSQVAFVYVVVGLAFVVAVQVQAPTLFYDQVYLHFYFIIVTPLK